MERRKLMAPTTMYSRGKVTRFVQVVLLVLVLMLMAAPSSAAPQSQPQSASSQSSSPTHSPAAFETPNAICPTGGQCFADVPSTNPFYTFINRIYQQDLVTGYPCGGSGEPCDPQSRPYYRPANNVTRQQMAKFIDNARRLPEIHLDVASGSA